MSCVGSWPTRDGSDDYPLAMDFSAVDVFASKAITSATATVTGASSGLTSAVTVGTPTVAANVATFRVSGGTEGVTYTITVTATNDASPPNVVQRSGTVATAAL